MTTINSVATAMFTVSSQSAAKDFYVTQLGWEVRTEVGFGDGDESGKWVEVAPPGSVAVVALNEPWDGGKPGGGAIGVESTDIYAEREALAAAGVTVGEFMGGEGPVPRMFSVADPDGNNI